MSRLALTGERWAHLGTYDTPAAAAAAYDAAALAAWGPYTRLNSQEIDA